MKQGAVKNVTLGQRIPRSPRPRKAPMKVVPRERGNPLGGPPMGAASIKSSPISSKPEAVLPNQKLRAGWFPRPFVPAWMLKNSSSSLEVSAASPLHEPGRTVRTSMCSPARMPSPGRSGKHWIYCHMIAPPYLRTFVQNADPSYAERKDASPATAASASVVENTFKSRDITAT